MPRKKRDLSKIDWLTTSELSRFINWHKQTIFKWIEEGKIPYMRIGHEYRFNRKEIEEWLKKHSVAATK